MRQAAGWNLRVLSTGGRGGRAGGWLEGERVPGRGEARDSTRGVDGAPGARGGVSGTQRTCPPVAEHERAGGRGPREVEFHRAVGLPVGRRKDSQTRCSGARARLLLAGPSWLARLTHELLDARLARDERGRGSVNLFGDREGVFRRTAVHSVITKGDEIYANIIHLPLLGKRLPERERAQHREKSNSDEEGAPEEESKGIDELRAPGPIPALALDHR